jgi:[ribosomal protein S18]-alanine N-acetyltransferase
MTAYVFRPMNDENAREISGWSYDPPYDFYDAASDPDDLAELLDPKRRGEVLMHHTNGGDQPFLLMPRGA